MLNRYFVSLGLCAALLFCAGCRSASSEASQTEVDLTIDPSPPLVGDADVSLTLSDVGGAALAGADVRLEGNMNHAGMKPSFAELREIEPGRYVGTLEFTMGGDWFILMTAKTPDGKTVQRKIDVLGVKSP
ncbi:MAG: FixH family protein [Planctomycetaceae bacterium]|nr:FixH family protein [Planctomycetales bacterium]MCB9922331.1 FixH family protein [Planctomycetaceae bacterium]